MITALLILGAIALFVTLVAIIVNLLMIVMVQRDLRDILTLSKINTGSIATTERLIIAIHAIFAADMAQGPMPPGAAPGRDIAMEASMDIPPDLRRIFRTEDGRHQADNFEDLMKKIAHDDRYRVANPNDMDRLRAAFDEYQNQLEDEDEEDIPGDEWKKGKKDEPEAE